MKYYRKRQILCLVW